MRNLLLFALTAALAACASSPAAIPADAATTDVQTAVDAPDATTPDATTPDATTPDATTPDATTPDATTPDVAADRVDASAPDVAVDTPAVDAAQDAGCARPDVMVLTARIDCGRGGAMCPAGYECLSFSGFVLQQYCGRSCRSDCDCPATERCGSYTDKAGTHPLCVASTM